MKIKTLLDELDGDGIVWEDSDLTGARLERLGLSHETSCLFLKAGDRQVLINALVRLGMYAIGEKSTKFKALADKALTIVNQEYLDE